MAEDRTFTLYWRTGTRELIKGRNVAEAMTLAGYGGGATRALDFWAEGDDREWTWIPATREWIVNAGAELIAQQGD